MTASRADAALCVRDFLTDSLGDPVDVELFRGFLAATGAALLRGGPALVRDPPGAGELLVAEFVGGPLVAVQLQPGAVDPTDLDTGLAAVLAACTRVHRSLGDGNPPPLAVLMEDIRQGARHQVRDLDGRALHLSALGIHTLVADAGTDDVTALLVAVGRLALPELAAAADLLADLAAVAAGDLPDGRRQALLALGHAAAARCRGIRLVRSTHPDPMVEATRSRLEATIDWLLEQNVQADPLFPDCLLTTLTEPPFDDGTVMK